MSPVQGTSPPAPMPGGGGSGGCGTRMLRIEHKGQPYDWFNLDEMGDVVRTADFVSILRDNIAHYFGIPCEAQAVYDEDGLLTTPVDFARALQSVRPWLWVYDLRVMLPDLKAQTARRLDMINKEVARSQRNLQTVGGGGVQALATDAESAWASQSAASAQHAGDTHATAAEPVPNDPAGDVWAPAAHVPAAAGHRLHRQSTEPLAQHPGLALPTAASPSSGGSWAARHGLHMSLGSHGLAAPGLPPALCVPPATAFGLSSAVSPRLGSSSVPAMTRRDRPAPWTSHAAAPGPRLGWPDGRQHIVACSGYVTPVVLGPTTGEAPEPPGVRSNSVSLRVCRLSPHTSPAQVGSTTLRLLSSPPRSTALPPGLEASDGCARGSSPSRPCPVEVHVQPVGSRLRGGSRQRPQDDLPLACGAPAPSFAWPTQPAPAAAKAGVEPYDVVEVRLSKNPEEARAQRFGFANVPTRDGRALLISWVDESGLLAGWNRLYPERTVAEGDRIVAVNGTGADIEAMRAHLQQDSVVMTVHRRGVVAC